MKYRTFARLRAGVAALAVAGVAFVGCRALTGPPSAPKAPSLADAVTGPDSDAGGLERIESGGSTPAPPTGAKPIAPPRRAAETVRTQPAPVEGATDGLTGWQREVITMQKEPLSNGEVKSGSRKWVVNGGGMRAEFRSDTDKGFDYWNRAKVDVNQNKRYDERWDFKKDGGIKRRVSPNDDENYTAEYNLKGGRWVRK